MVHKLAICPLQPDIVLSSCEAGLLVSCDVVCLSIYRLSVGMSVCVCVCVRVYVCVTECVVCVV